MQWDMSLLCSVTWLFLLHFGSVCLSTETRWKKMFCDPAFSNQTAGAITQTCSSGFYREQTGPYRGQCVPCSCNGLSNECDGHTGNCANCQFNTTGDRCERCKEGYYGNAANRTCQACPCPSTRNNFALACLDIGSGVIECLCKRGYIGVRCERCAFGYYGNPVVDGGSCQPCNCKDDTLSLCDSLTGECITSGDNSCGVHCHECNSCTVALLVDLEKMDDVLARLKQQLQNFTNDPGSVSGLNHLEANISETKILVDRYSSAVRHLNLKVEKLKAGVDVVGDDLSQLIDEPLQTASHLERVLQNVNGSKLKAEDLLSEAEALLTGTQDMIKLLADMKPGESVTLSENNKAWMLEEALHMVQKMRERSCTAQTDREQEEAHTLLDITRNRTAPVEILWNALITTNSFLREVIERLLDGEDTVDWTQGLNLKSRTMLQHVEHLHTQLERENSSLSPVIEMTKYLLKNVTHILLMLERIKKEIENLAAQLDGAKLELNKKLNNIFLIMPKVNNVTEAEEHAEELNRVAAEFQRVLHNASNSADLLSAFAIGANNKINKEIEKAEMAANQSGEMADRISKDMKEGDLVKRAAGVKDNSAPVRTEANETQSDHESLSDLMNNHKDRVKKQTERGQSLRINISVAGDDLRKIRRDDTEVLIESVRRAASASNSTVSNVTERLRTISQEVGTMTVTNVSVNIDDMLIDADQALKTLNTALPALKDKIKQVEALSGKVPPSANMTESIWRIKDVIEETRNYVNRLPIATTFNGKSHVELSPPRNLRDIKAFTAVDLLINRHQNNPSEADNRRKRRQDKHREGSFFVFYLGNEDVSGDYIGMAIRNNVLICVYKLGGVVHEVETSQITTTNVKSSHFDRVIFHRVYQDAEVNITQNFTSQKPVILSPIRKLPKTITSILNLDPDSIVVYVGGYPDDFTPPVELHYPKYRGAIKLSYINDNPVSLFNYKHAANMDPKQPAVKIPMSEVSDHYEGTGYRMAFVKEPDKIKRRLFKFHINSRETNALLFYIGNEESFFCVFLERGFLVLQGQRAGRELRLQSVEKVSLFDKRFAIIIADEIIVHYGENQISTDHNQTNYKSYYIGGLPAPLRQRHNITAPPLRGCVDHLTAEAEIVNYNKTIGVSDGCPHSILGVRSATLHSALSVDSLFVWDKQPLRVSLGFRSMNRHGTLFRGSSQGSTSVQSLQLSLVDGFAVLNSDNYTLRSDKRLSDGNWHYLSAVRRTTGLELSIDNVKVPQGPSFRSRPLDQNLHGGKFTGCIANLYTRRPEQSFTPADLSSFSLMGDVVPGRCSLSPPAHSSPVLKRTKKFKPIQAPAGKQCRRWRAQHGEYQLYEKHSWLSYILPPEDLNHRPHFSLDIKTKSSKGLILHAAGRGVIPLLALYLANGKIKMSLGQNRIIQHKQKSNDGNWHKVELSVEKSTFHLLVDGVRVTDGHLPNNEGSSLNLHNPVYLGADPKSKNIKGHNVPMSSFIGCLRDFKMNEDITESEASHNILPCSDRLPEMGTHFGGGYIILDKYFTSGSQFELAFELRPQHLTGLLFHVQNQKTSLTVFLKETKVGVRVNDGNGAVSVTVTPPGSLCDGKFHVVTVLKQLEVIKLVVDSMSEQKASPLTSTAPSTLDTLYIGGTARKNKVPVSSPFVGCLRNVKLNGRPVAFETGSSVVGSVSISRCPAN